MNIIHKKNIFKKGFFFTLLLGGAAVFSYLFPKQSFAFKGNEVIHPQVAEPKKPVVSLESCFCSKQIFQSDGIEEHNSIKYSASIAPVEKKVVIKKNYKPAVKFISHNLTLKPTFLTIVKPVGEIETSIKINSKSVVLIKNQSSYENSLDNFHLWDFPQILTFSNFFIYYLKINIKEIYTDINFQDEKNKKKNKNEKEFVINYNYLNLNVGQKIVCTKNLPLYNLEIGSLGIITEIVTVNTAKTVFNNTKATLSLNEKTTIISSLHSFYFYLKLV